MTMFYIVGLIFRLKAQYLIGIALILYLTLSWFVPGDLLKGMLAFIIHKGEIIQHTIAFTLGLMISSVIEDYFK